MRFFCPPNLQSICHPGTFSPNGGRVPTSAPYCSTDVLGEHEPFFCEPPTSLGESTSNPPQPCLVDPNRFHWWALNLTMTSCSPVHQLHRLFALYFFVFLCKHNAGNAIGQQEKSIFHSISQSPSQVNLPSPRPIFRSPSTPGSASYGLRISSPSVQFVPK